MGTLIQFPRHHPGKNWSPAEILAIREPPDTRKQVRQQRSRSATTKAVAAVADKRASKRAKRKQAIVAVLDAGDQWTVTALMRLVGDRTNGQISRTTVTELLKELEAEGFATNINQFWKSTRAEAQKWPIHSNRN